MSDDVTCPYCNGAGRIPNPPTRAVAGGPRCDYVNGDLGARCEMTPHGRAYVHQITSPPLMLPRCERCDGTGVVSAFGGNTALCPDCADGGDESSKKAG